MLESVKFFDFDLSNCISIRSMFKGCGALRSFSYCSAEYMGLYVRTTTNEEYNKDIIRLPLKTTNKLNDMKDFLLVSTSRERHFKIGGENFNISNVAMFQNPINTKYFSLDYFVCNIESLNKFVDNYETDKTTEISSTDVVMFHTKLLNLDMKYVKEHFKLGRNVIEETALLMDIYGDSFDEQCNE